MNNVFSSVMLNAWRVLLAVLFFVFISVAVASESIEETYSSIPAFLSDHFQGEVSPTMLWLNSDQREAAKEISGEDPGFRQRYWREDDRLVFVFDVIGRDHPITVAILVGPDGVEDMRVLVYRESRGWEVRHDFFTRQFMGAQLRPQENKLDARIDNISGATLSVRAMKRAARLALWGYHEVFSQ